MPEEDGYFAKGEKNPRSRLTDAGVRRARELESRGVPQRDIARELGVAQSTVHYALRGRTWRHVK